MQAYAPELNKRCRPHLKPTNRVKGEDKYLYRALDSTGQTIDLLLTAKRDTAAAKRFLRRAIEASGNPMPRVINVDKNPAYPAAVEALKADGTIPRRVVLRQCKYLNNVIEQDHRTVKKRDWLAKGYGYFQSAWRTLQGIETVNMIRKGRVSLPRPQQFPDLHQPVRQQGDGRTDGSVYAPVVEISPRCSSVTKGTWSSGYGPPHWRNAWTATTLWL